MQALRLLKHYKKEWGCSIRFAKRAHETPFVCVRQYVCYIEETKCFQRDFSRGKGPMNRGVVFTRMASKESGRLDAITKSTRWSSQPISRRVFVHYSNTSNGFHLILTPESHRANTGIEMGRQGRIARGACLCLHDCAYIVFKLCTTFFNVKTLH